MFIVSIYRKFISVIEEESYYLIIINYYYLI